MSEKELAKRFNTGKPQLSYVLDFPNTLRAVAAVCEMGTEKYGRDDWKKGRPVRDTIDSAMRHLLAFAGGEDIDPESGQRHLAHAIWNLAAIIEYMEICPEVDDRDKGDK